MTAFRIPHDLEVRRFSRTANSITAQVHVPPDCRYFEGHFPGYPILPGVAQLAVISHLLEQSEGAGTRMTRIRRAKFTSTAGPDAILTARIDLNRAANRGTWDLSSARSQVSSGDFEWSAGEG